jgi:DNA-binding transcriptional ArsR family regulator
VTELAEPFDVSLPAISRHLKVLERAGLINRDRAAQYQATGWMAPYRELWEGRLDRLGAHMKKLEKGQGNA